MRRRIPSAAVSLAAGLSLSLGWSSDFGRKDETEQGRSACHANAQLASPLRQLHVSIGSAREEVRSTRPAWLFDVRGFLRSGSVFPVAYAEAPTPVLPLAVAYRASLLQPLLSYMPDDCPQPLTEETLRALEAAALEGFKDGREPTQPARFEDPSSKPGGSLHGSPSSTPCLRSGLHVVVTVAWALAWAGHQPGQPYLEKLQAAAASGSLHAAQPRPLSPAHRAVLLWCAVMHGAATPEVWAAGLRSLAAAAPAAALDECAVLYLLHASLLHAADVTQPGARAATSAGTGLVSPASPAAASAASPACQPRATREEVLSVAAPLGRKALAKLGVAYGEYVPLHPAIEGPYLALLFVVEQLAAAAGKAEPWVPAGAPEAAAAILGNPKELARIKRDLLYHWRGDELVDEVQRVRNEVSYMLTRRMGLTVSQPDDVDVAVPSRWLALYVQKQGGGGGGSGRGDGGDGGVGVGRHGPSVADLEGSAGDALELLMRDRFAPHVRMPAPSASGAQQQQRQNQVAAGNEAIGGGPAGMRSARARQLRRLGWRTVVVDVGTWKAMGGDAERQDYLLRLLRGRT